MNRDRLQGILKLVRGAVREHRGRLVSDYVAVANARREQIAGKIQERCGFAQEQAIRELAAWRRRHSALT